MRWCGEHLAYLDALWPDYETYHVSMNEVHFMHISPGTFCKAPELTTLELEIVHMPHAYLDNHGEVKYWQRARRLADSGHPPTAIASSGVSHGFLQNRFVYSSGRKSMTTNSTQTSPLAVSTTEVRRRASSGTSSSRGRGTSSRGRSARQARRSLAETFAPGPVYGRGREKFKLVSVHMCRPAAS